MPVYRCPNLETLLAALHLCGDAAAWRQPVDRQRGDDGSWALRAARLPGLDDYLVTAEDGAWEACPSLLQALPLQPAPGLQRGLTYLLLPTVADFRAVVREALLLGDDRLSWQALADGRILLRATDPSPFLLDRWRLPPTWGLFQPTAAEGRVLLPLGQAYPLPAHLAFAPGDEGDLWLVLPEGPWVHVRAGFSELYEHLLVDPAQFAEQSWPTAATTPQVTVQLRLEPAEPRQPTALWWLDADELVVLERLLQEGAESELNRLQVAVLEGPDQRPQVVLLERAAGLLPPPIRGGREFAARLPVEGLYLPVDRRLAPLLGRRSLVEALGLAEEHLTVLWPTDGGLEVRRCARTALRPLSDLVHWQVTAAAPGWRDLVAGVSLETALETPTQATVPAAAAGGWWHRLRRRLRG
ncbi:MAG: hypothetical protein IT204_18315 [Fimbriimonadaceae bacterium]|nr:hypothetical protein [Fimbriimonadaceae bacterium]